jgi:tRNA G37 N-methylase Trm5
MSKDQIIIYQIENGKTAIDVKIENDTVWLTLNQISDNKRIAAYLLFGFLDKNGILYKSDVSKRIADNALVALTLMISESKSDEKEMMVKVIVNLINVNN